MHNDSNSSRRMGIIDLGSNTARLVVMRLIPGYAFRLEDEIREVVRLREGMVDGNLAPEAMARALSTLRLFQRYCRNAEVSQVIATATSAVRIAGNGPAFVERVAAEVGLTLRVLSGVEEAQYDVIGALNERPVVNGFVLDIGGGSAQISRVIQRRFERGVALPLGALALTEAHITQDPPSKKELRALRAAIDAQLDTLTWLGEDDASWPLIGLGGTIRNLAYMAARRSAYPLNTLHGFALTSDALDAGIRQLSELPLKERRRLDGLNQDRADIILAGALVLRAVMARRGAAEVTVALNGLREGLFFEQFWNHLDYPVIDNIRRFSVINLARLYDYQKRHSGHVRFLANRLFDQLQPLHGYGAAERELLEGAALLHDLGTVISYFGHHKHSQTLIINSGLPGYSPRETALIALLTRYHRKGEPSLGPFSTVTGQGDEKRLIVLSAILRLAEFLERGRNATVDDVTASWDDQTLRLTLLADEYPAVELWEAERKAVDLLATAFARQVLLSATATPDILPAGSSN